MATLGENVKRAIVDFDSIKTKIESYGVEIPKGTPTSDYENKIEEVYEAGINVTKEKPFVDTSKVTIFRLFCSPHAIPQTQLKNIDLSNATNTYQMFMSDQWNPSVYTEIPKLDTSKVLYMGYMFQGCSTIETIEGIDFTSATQLNGMFSGCTSLKNLTVNGTIKASSLSTSSCTLLSKASIESIINALSDETEALSATFSQTAVDNAFETEEGLTDGSTSQEWADLIATKANWTISLA